MRKRKNQKLHRCSCRVCQQHPYGRTAKEHRAVNRVLRFLDERNRRRFVGLLALQGGRGSVSELAVVTGMSRNTIRRGRAEIQHGNTAQGVRQPGGGRPLVEKNNPRF